MWDTLNSNKKESNKSKDQIVKSIGEKSNNKHEEYLKIPNQAEHDSTEKVWKYLQKRRQDMLENMSQSTDIENTSMKKSDK